MKTCPFCLSAFDSDTKSCPKCGHLMQYDAPAHHLPVGTVLSNRYVVGAAIGEGGFGVTYIGRDSKLDMRVAIKEYYPSGYVNRNNTVSAQLTYAVSAQRGDFVEKGKASFLNEARALAKFAGEPGIVEVRDFFEGNNTAYIVMDYIDGQTLKDFIKFNGTLTPDAAIELLTPVMKSLCRIHSYGIIHRDISPDNIMLLPGNHAKLIDFGAARNITAENNKSLSVLLKPGYAPEEQYRSRGEQGPWTDVYALCATLYKCITGKTPDEASQRLFEDELKRPSQLGIKISPSIEKAIMHGLEVRRSNRIPNVEALMRELSQPVPTSSPELKKESKFDTDDDKPTTYIPKNEIKSPLHYSIDNDKKKDTSLFSENKSTDSKDKSAKKIKKRSIIAATVALFVILICYISGLSPDAYVGDTVYFGKYGGTDIRWTVEDIDGNDALLVSTVPISNCPYDDIIMTSDWYYSDARSWLNSDFKYDAFSFADRLYLRKTELPDLDVCDSVFPFTHTHSGEIYAAIWVKIK